MDKEIIKLMRKAIKNGDLDLVKNLLASNEGLLEVDTVFGSWLHVASAHGKYEIVEYLIERGMDINKNGGISEGAPIENAATKGYLNIIELLYKSGANLDVSAATKNPLFAAIYGGHYEVVKFLVEQEIDITVQYAIGKLENVDAYEYARQFGQTEIANYLEKKLIELKSK